MGRAKKEERAGTLDKPNIGSPGTLDRMPAASLPQRSQSSPLQKSMLQTLKEKFQSQEEIQQRALKDAQNFGKATQI